MRLLLALLLTVALGAPSYAHETRADSTRVYPGREGRVDVATPRLTDPSIIVDGRLDEAAWESAAVLTGFTQFEPNEGVPATQRTEILVFYTPSDIYFGVRAYDTEPSRVRATLAERDALMRSDDWVRIALDTYDDAQRAFVFYVNPLGVQQDGLWIEGYERPRGGGFGPPIDFNPDFRWDSEGRVAEIGYRVEIRIPLKSLRFPSADRQTWAINVARRVQRSGYLSTWAPLTRDRSNELAQAGRLQQLEALDPGLFLEVNPVATARRIGEIRETGGPFVHGDVEPEFGANVNYGLTSNLMLNATINPDFSQVEADAGQIAVNERFALFFPEKRPFFLEGTEIFQMPRSLVYTRRIADPRAAAKLTGKVAGTNAGYLGAVEATDAGEAVYNVVRVRRDVGQGTVGAVYTDRTVVGDGRFNRVAAADARLPFGGRYTAQLLGAGVWRDESGDADDGTLLFASLERSGRNLTAEASWEAVSPGFETETGFIRRRDLARVQGQIEYLRFGEPGAFLEETGPSLRFERVWDHRDFWNAGSAAEGMLQAGWSFSVRGNMHLRLELTRRFFDFDAAEYDGLFTAGPADAGVVPWTPDGLRFGGLDEIAGFFFTNTLDWLRGFVRLGWAEQPIFDPVLGVAIERARSFSVRSNVTLRPTDALSVELNLQHERLNRPGGDRYSTATIPRVKAQYQLTRALFVRLIGEYGAVETAELHDPETGRPLVQCFAGSPCTPLGGDVRNDVHVETLVAYEPAPGTVVYAGYTRDMIEPDAFGLGGLEPRADGLFVKLSYLWRL